MHSTLLDKHLAGTLSMHMVRPAYLSPLAECDVALVYDGGQAEEKKKKKGGKEGRKEGEKNKLSI